MDMIATRYHRVPTMGSHLPVELLVDDGFEVTGRSDQRDQCWVKGLNQRVDCSPGFFNCALHGLQSI